MNNEEGAASEVIGSRGGPNLFVQYSVHARPSLGRVFHIFSTSPAFHGNSVEKHEMNFVVALFSTHSYKQMKTN